MTDNHYHKLYNIDYTKTFLACDINCPVCEIWSKPPNIWRFFEFFPYHCINCYHAGYSEDFEIIFDRALVCLKCGKKAKNELKKRFFKHKNMFIYKKLKNF